MNPLSISRLIFDTIPQLYEAKEGRYPVDLKLKGETTRVWSLIPLSKDLQRYLDEATRTWEELRPMTEGDITQIIEREWIQQKFIISWLESQTKIKSWGKILDYSRRLSRRLTEQQLHAKTLVIEPGLDSVEAVKLNDEDFFKVFDWLGSSHHTYFRVDEDLNIRSYEAIPGGSHTKDGFRFYPHILQPIIENLKTDDSVVIHISENAGIMIANRDGLLASKRTFDSWTIYDIDHVLESVAEIVKPKLKSQHCKAKPTNVACSLFQILFDVMDKRHGGLFILDKTENLPRYVIKGIEKSEDSPMKLLFNHSPTNELLYSVAEARKLVELSSVDGSVILDLHGNLLQFGSMIMAHPTAPNRFGTREAAGWSAAKYGATAFKISSDGDMSLFFTTPDITGDEVHRFDFR